MEVQALIAQILKKMDSGIHGRVQLQKLVYFCKAFGTDVNTNYKLYIYGPYSQQVADSLQDGVQDEIFIEANGSIGKGQKYAEYIDSLPETEILKDRQEEIVAAVLGGFGSLSTKQLEILATTFFINRQQKALFGSSDEESVLEKVRRAKASRFSEDEIENSYQRMLEICVPLEKKYSF